MQRGVVGEVPQEIIPFGIKQDPFDARLAAEHEAALPERGIRRHLRGRLLAGHVGPASMELT